MKAFRDKEAAERRRLTDVLDEQLRRDTLRLLHEEIHTDLTLHVGQTTFKVHKAVLQARSPKFYAKFVVQNATEDAVSVPHVESSEIQGLLRTVYGSLWSAAEIEDYILQMTVDKPVLNHDPNNEECSNLQSRVRSDVHNTENLINELPDQNAQPVENLNFIDNYDSKPSSELGKDLLSLFKGSICTDLIIQTEDKCFHAHRAILCARSSYFAAMLSGSWVETSQNLIQIQNVKSADMVAILYFIYGGVGDLPKSIEAGQILSIADMYGMEQLREVAIYVLKRDYCKFFVKPMVGMQQSVLECLSIAYSVGEDPLYTSCMKWMERYFVKCWSERSFASLPSDLQRNCLSALVKSISYRNAAFLLMESDRLSSSLPVVKWTERVRNLVSELQEECVKCMVINFSQTIRSESFAHLLQAQGMSSRPYLLEHVFNEIEKNVSFENCSSQFVALDELLHLAIKYEMVFTCKIQAVRDKLWSFLVQSFYAVRHTEGWKLMRPSDQDKIQAAAVDKGDDRRLAKKPTFTSSQKKRPKIVTIKDLHSPEKKSYSDSYLLDRRKMKSDSLNASGHTTNVTRSSAGKGKEDDAKGKDVKKVTTKLSKDLKPSEKTAVARPKTILKNKLENHDNATTDSCASRSDSSSNPKHTSSVRTGTRPKATNGNSTQPAKVKSLKKTVKDPASPVKGSVPSIKSANCNGELSNSSPSPGETNPDRTIHEQQHSASSQQLHKTLKNNLDSSKDLAAAGTNLKSPKTNGVPVKRKVNEVGSRDPNSATKKIPVDGKDDSGLVKKKAIKVTNVAQQRPKSAPASLAKKQGASGEVSDLHKSVSSKQTDAKADAKLLNNTTSAEKQVSMNKKTAKTSLAPASKAQSAVPSTKPGPNVCKSSVTNHKEPKNKVTTSSKTLSLNHKSSQKSSPSKGKKCQSTPTNGTEALVYLEEQSRQSASSQLVNGTIKAKPCLQNDQETSMGNQDSDKQEPNLESFQCQENLTTTSVLQYRSKLNKALIEATNESNIANDDDGAGKVHIISVAGEKKADCKNICDSENSKCADSSSESELCSVKEVERIPKEKEDMTLLQLSPNTGTQNSSAPESCLLGSSEYHIALNNGGPYMRCSSERRLSDYQTDKHIAEAVDHESFEFIGQWNKHSGMLHERESPESESGTASTSSDDIKPRSEDYDAGGSQDDDGSNERGISKCSTMRCHDFLGRSSSDTSTPEELKGYDGSLRIDVKMKKDSTEFIRVNSTSEDEGPRKRIEPWLHREVPRHSPSHAAVCNSVQFSQEIEHLSSSADETEDERSETESTGIKVPEEVVASEPFQGIVNLAFDDIAEMENEAQRAAGNSFVRTVLLSVDECEELGSDDGDPHPLAKPPSLTPTDVFDGNADDSKYSGCSNNHGSRLMDDNMDCSSRSQALVNERSMADKGFEESGACNGGDYKSTEADFKSQARPCHLDLYSELSSDTQRFCSNKTGNACKNQFLDYQGRDNLAPSTESSNSVLSAGHIDDNDSLAQTCMYDHRPPKSLSPIYEMDPGEGIEQRLKTEARILDIEIEDQQFVERDWTLLRQLLADHGSDVDIINSVPEDLSLAQYLINQTLLLARENSKSQGKAWGDLSSPFEDSTSVTVTSFSPDESSSPHGEWTILELETHH